MVSNVACREQRQADQKPSKIEEAGHIQLQVAGVHGGRTHPGTRRRPRSGFEDREDHRASSTPKGTGINPSVGNYTDGLSAGQS